jgi:hypothetical protein
LARLRKFTSIFHSLEGFLFADNTPIVDECRLVRNEDYGGCLDEWQITGDPKGLVLVGASA